MLVRISSPQESSTAFDLSVKLFNITGVVESLPKTATVKVLKRILKQGIH